ncbi:MAG: hypothetical protein FK731_09115 [Asgard group archaeon]|nr:hypothetical protein [Asgard group archaeon]
MFERILGFRSIQRKIEHKLIQLSFIPSKYFESLYVECGTKITCHTCDICEIEEKTVRDELLKLMKRGKVDTNIELEKFLLFERINAVYVKSSGIRLLMNEHVNKMSKQNYNRLVEILKECSIAAKLMHQSVKLLYDNYDKALEKVEELKTKCNKIIEGLFSFRFCDRDGDGILEYSFEDPELLIGNSLRSSLQEMINVGDKIIHIIKTFSFNHQSIKEKEGEKKKWNF